MAIGFARVGWGGGVTGRLLDAKTGAPIAQALVEVEGLTSPTTGPDVLTAGEARQREQGAPGSLATLSIRREGQARMFTLTRAR